MKSSAKSILYLHSSAELYGSDRQLINIVDGLDQDRYKPHVVVPFDGELVDVLRKSGATVTVSNLAVLRREHLSVSGLAKLAARAAADQVSLARLANNCDAKLVHSNTSAVLSGLPLARRLRVPHITHVREFYQDMGSQWPPFRRYLERSDRLLCISEAVKSQFSSKNTQLIYDGVASPPLPLPSRLQAREKLQLPPDNFVVALPGRISDWKGHSLLLQAAAAIPQNPTIIFAGDEWQNSTSRSSDLKAEVTSLGLDGTVRFLGFQSSLDHVFAAADLIATPSTRPEPLSNVAVEAALRGCCVVAANHGGLPEVLNNGACGLLFEANDYRSLATTLTTAFANPGLRSELGSKAIPFTQERFGLKQFQANINAVYDQQLN